MPRGEKLPRRAAFIYGLVDPRTGVIFYVGKTTNPGTRVQRHLGERSNRRRVQWIHELIGTGVKPVLVILESVLPPVNWGERERSWIAEGKRLGWPLTNVSEGGEGSEPHQYVNDRRNGRRPSQSHGRTSR